MLVNIHLVWIKSYAIIFDLDHEFILIPLQGYIHIACRGVLLDIVQRLPVNIQDLALDLRLELARLAITMDVDFQIIATGDRIGEFQQQVLKIALASLHSSPITPHQR
jgi:hypothetical protein